MIKALVLLAEGVEEMEAVIAVDVLRRCGLDVVMASTGVAREVTAARGVRLVADALLGEVQPDGFDVLVIPGGAGGSRRLAGDARVLELVRWFVREGLLVAAVCAGPAVLKAAGVLTGVRVTCHPAARDLLAGVELSPDRVVVDRNIITTNDSKLTPVTKATFITSQGPGTSMEWALAIAKHLVGDEIADKVAEGLIL